MKQRLEKQIIKVLPFDITYQFDKVFEKLELDSNGYDQSRDTRFIQAFKSAACGSYEDAVAQFGDLAQAYPADAFIAYFHAGLCGLLGGLVSDAAIAFDRALNLKADDFWAHVYTGAVYHVIGLEGRANAHWFAASKIDPNEISQNLLTRYFTDDLHPERLALFPLCSGKGIDVGCGHRKTHPDAIGIDLVLKGEILHTADNVAGRLSQADIKATGDQLPMFGDDSLDYVVQRHNLEHYQDPIQAIQEWKRILKPGGILAMVVPDDAVCDSIHLDPSHKHVFTQSSLLRIIELIGGLRVSHIGPLLFRWSFICVAEKTEARDRAPLDYCAVLREFEDDQIRRKVSQYKSSGLDLLAGQCLKFIRDETISGQVKVPGSGPPVETGGNGRARKRFADHSGRKPLYLGLDRGNNYGWGVCSQNLVRELAALTHVCDLNDGAGDPVEKTVDGKLFQALKNGEFTPLLEDYRGRENFGYTFFETELTERSVENAKRFDMILAGSTWCKTRMLEKGITNCEVLVQGIDPDLFYPTEDAIRGDRFVIFSGGKFELRKGQDLVLRAVQILQEKYPDIWLVNCWYNLWQAPLLMMKNSPHIRFEHCPDLSWQENMMRTCSDNGLDPARVVSCELTPHEQLRGLYAQTDLGVFPNRCEGGTNLVLMEYMACGKPVVASNTSGHRDILTPQNALLLDNLADLSVVSGNGEKMGRWQEPSLDELVSKIEFAYLNREVIKSIGKKAAEDLGRLTWRRSAQRLLELLGIPAFSDM